MSFSWPVTECMNTIYNYYCFSKSFQFDALSVIKRKQIVKKGWKATLDSFFVFEGSWCRNFPNIYTGYRKYDPFFMSITFLLFLDNYCFKDEKKYTSGSSVETIHQRCRHCICVLCSHNFHKINPHNFQTKWGLGVHWYWIRL